MMLLDALRGAHLVFHSQFDFLERNIAKIDSSGILKGQAALLAAALAAHAELEEQRLFLRLEPHLGTFGPLAVMRGEHHEIEGSLARISQLEGVEAIKSTLMDTIAVARHHFLKEEQILFQLAEQTLGEADLKL
jgi:hypothetical protein